MTTISRRALLRTASLLPIAGAVVACAGQTAATIAATAAQDIGLIGSGLSGALPALAASGVVSSSALSQVTGYINNIEQVATSVTTASTVAQGQSAVQQIETLLNSVVSALAGLTLPAPFGPALSAASVLLPVVETAVGLAITTISSSTAAAPAPQAAMTADEARLILIAATKK